MPKWQPKMLVDIRPYYPHRGLHINSFDKSLHPRSLNASCVTHTLLSDYAPKLVALGVFVMTMI
jgi:hypothetical protein